MNEEILKNIKYIESRFDEQLSYNLMAYTEEFSVEDAPQDVMLYSMRRNMFWKQNCYGYSLTVLDAGLFSLDVAKKYVKQDVNNDTKIVYFD